MSYYGIKYRKLNEDGTFENSELEIESTDLISATQKALLELGSVEIYTVSKKF